jgi:hypothetical protein
VLQEVVGGDPIPSIGGIGHSLAQEEDLQECRIFPRKSDFSRPDTPELDMSDDLPRAKK